MNSEVEQVLATATLVTELLNAASGAMSLYLTVISGYLLVAYLVGKDLTLLQTTIITTLFIFFCSTNTLATMSYMQNAYYFGQTYGAGRAQEWWAPLSGTLLALGVFAALKFMWDVRHPRTK
jgi:hypothetical protein